MSQIDINGIHSVVSYVAGETKPLGDQRLSVVYWRTDKTTGTKQESKCVSIPRISELEVTEKLDALKPWITEQLYNVQNKIVRELITAGTVHIKNEDIDLAAITSYILSSSVDSEGKTNRLTKESVGNWFDTNLSDLLMITLSDKLGIGDHPSNQEASKITAITNEFRNKISALAGGKTSYLVKEATAIRNALSLISGDQLADRFIVRLDKMINCADENNLLSALM